MYCSSPVGRANVARDFQSLDKGASHYSHLPPGGRSRLASRSARPSSGREISKWAVPVPGTKVTWQRSCALRARSRLSRIICRSSLTSDAPLAVFLFAISLPAFHLSGLFVIRCGRCRRASLTAYVRFCRFPPTHRPPPSPVASLWVDPGRFAPACVINASIWARTSGVSVDHPSILKVFAASAGSRRELSVSLQETSVCKAIPAASWFRRARWRVGEGAGS